MFVRPTAKGIALAEQAKAKLLAQADFFPEGCVIDAADYGLTDEETAALVACGVITPDEDES